MEILSPWFESANSRLVDELYRELPPGHVLENVEVSVVARRHDCDDVLFTLNDGSGRLAAVHLTWKKTRETIPTYPNTRIFQNFDLWLEYMQAAHDASAQDDPDGQLWLKEQELWNRAQCVE
jgi:hypothetical protein